MWSRVSVAPAGVEIAAFPNMCLNTSPKPLSATSRAMSPVTPWRLDAQRSWGSTRLPARSAAEAIRSSPKSRVSLTNSRNLAGAW